MEYWSFQYVSNLNVPATQLKKYGDRRTSVRSKSPRSGNGGKVRPGKDFWKLSNNYQYTDKTIHHELSYKKVNKEKCDFGNCMPLGKIIISRFFYVF